MSDQEWVIVGLLAAAVCAAGCAATAYPGLPRLLTRLARPTQALHELRDDDLPMVTIVIAGGSDVRPRVEAALATDYPAERLDVLVAGAGRDFDHPRVRTLPTDLGASLADILPRARADVVLVSSGDHYDSARELAARFLDPQVCATTGRVVLTAADGPDRTCETFVKLCEGPVGRLLGARPGLIAVRRPTFAPATFAPSICFC
jgi:hypothetical protein